MTFFHNIYGKNLLYAELDLFPVFGRVMAEKIIRLAITLFQPYIGIALSR